MIQNFFGDSLNRTVCFQEMITKKRTFSSGSIAYIFYRLTLQVLSKNVADDILKLFFYYFSKENKTFMWIFSEIKWQALHFSKTIQKDQNVVCCSCD